MRQISQCGRVSSRRASYDLALLYQKGSGVTQDIVAAYALMKVAAELGCDEGRTIWKGLPSATHLARFAQKMIPEQLAAARDQICPDS